ncbi:hypothetical protein M431DRAFT_555405 [Trichoderma harzianum CBS 226.95]|uniref:Uncharacterized protein n=1 Tax=Trichoderma harzianum CBS 226.95 TaxID=983964 RepID=A0A2T4AA78_TRIHA|nr:hypothetical protein M431DRAFT_555405 [Trichoderma harzianum CBS 226.95]PTB53994.1 hypothetical protein M431DRAFT_555405 [Trichoderma harzianum CBS 226.95]
MEKFVCGAYNRCQFELSTLFPQTITDGDGREEDEGICLPRVGLRLYLTPHTTYRLQQHVFPSARQSSRPRESGRGSSPFGPMRHSSEAVESSFHQALAPKRPRPESLGSLSAQSAHRECEEAFVGLVARLFGTIHAAAVSSPCPVTAHPLLLSAGRFRSTRMAIGNGNLADVTVAPR